LIHCFGSIVVAIFRETILWLGILEDINWQVGFDAADWWSGRSGFYSVGEEHMSECKR
jgi:hypothetical protein